MLHSGKMIGTEKHEVVTRNLKLTNAVQDNVTVDVSGSVVSVLVSANYHLMSRKCFSSKLHAELLGSLGCKSVLVPIIRIETHDVVMRLDVAKCIILPEMLVYGFALHVEIGGIAVDTVYQIEVAWKHTPVLVEDGFVRELVVLHRQVICCSPVIGIIYLDVFNCRHGTLLSAP